MKWSFVLLLMSCMHLSAAVYAQQERMDISVKDISVEQLIKTIKAKVNVDFLYNIKEIERNGTVSVEMKNATVEEVLQMAFKGKSLAYDLVNGVFVIRPLQVIAQDSVKKMYDVKGKVLDNKKQPLPGVTIRLDGTTVGTAADNEGKFVLRIPQTSGHLIFTFVGFKQKKVAFKVGEPLTVILEEDVTDLDEVVVRAYGTQNKREMVSAISRVTAEEMKELPSASVISMLQGRLAGVNIVNQSGAPGSAAVVAIRGYNSLFVDSKGYDAAGNSGQPLYVVDGIPMHSFISPVTGTNTLADLDPSTIESVEVLKDAAAASIYGSRASNGVILITTKKGRSGTSSFSANASYTLSQLMEYPLQTGGRMERWNQLMWRRNFQQPNYYTSEQFYPNSYKEAFGTGGVYDYFWQNGSRYQAYMIVSLQDSLNPFYNNSTNWWKYTFRTAKVTNVNIQSTGGTEKFQYMVGAGYYDETGIMINSKYSRVNLISNMTSRPTKQFQIDTRVYLAYMDRSVNTGGMSNGRYEGATVDPTGQSTLDAATGIVGDEWLKLINGTVVRSDDYRAMANVVLTYYILNGLQLSASGNVDYSQANLNKFEPSYLNPNVNENKSSGEISRNVSLNTEELLTYKRSFKDVHNVDILLGFSANKTQVFGIGGFGKRGASDDIYYYDPSRNPSIYDYGTASYPNIQSTTSYASSFTEKTLISLFTRFGYNYKQRYLMEFAFRRDGSSTFGENNRWANFPSIALGWAFSEEKLIKDYLGHWLNWGKIRGSYGTSGQIFGYEYLAYGLLSGYNHTFLGNSGMTVSTPVSPNLTWEKSEQYDLGLDLDMFDYRLNLKLDYYYKLSKSLIYNVPMPGDMYVYQYHIENAMEISNEGLELELSYDVLRESAVKWRTKFNVSKNWNRFEKSYDGQDKAGLVIGRPLYQIYVYDDSGFYNSEDEVPTYYKTDGSECYLEGTSTAQNYSGLIGMQKIRDLNNDGYISSDKDMYPAASPLPQAYGGWVNEVTWKNFSLNVLFNYSIGRHMINMKKGSVKASGPIFADLKDYKFWNGSTENANYVRVGTEYRAQVRSNLEKVHSVSLKQLTLGYDLPQNILKKTFFKEIRFFATGENLFYLSNYSGENPETVNVYTGLDEGKSYPLPRKWTLGLTLKF
ncbi:MULTISPECIES: SusC/RagA family TonB-linked outer membrane protein [Butyricimonas]|uniref:SusC/RagA family TonB-linked outer membrane protein n=1 Tax=Butyricimonas TaxID=574697 RepID=UPI001E52B50E|nr:MULTISPECIES: SusC/RagA family TonB-linked outer membrane protein [Butyricimonas]